MTSGATGDLTRRLTEARACRLCADTLPHGPNPVLRATPGARILVVGQAPGRRVHESGIPWNDPSGDRLRAWLGVDRASFYESGLFAILPVGFCYPGTDSRGADRPPMRICAPTWHPYLLAALPEPALTLVIGQHAQRYYLGRRRQHSMTETVRRYRAYLPAGLWPLPHPSWRNSAWLKRHPWFTEELLPALRARIQNLIDCPAGQEDCP